jgi:hypothetical protein
MSTKTLVWIGVTIGSVIGQFLPALFGVSIFSSWTILTSAIGAILGIVAGIKIGDAIN